MKSNRFAAATALVAVGALALAACSGPDRSADPTTTGGTGEETANSSITIAWEAPLNSLNTNSNNGNATQNAIVQFLLDDLFYTYDSETLETIPNPGFGTIEKISDSPLQVKYTYADGVAWSDGTPVDVADLVLDWAATSGNFNTIDIEEAMDDEGNLVDVGADQVAFNSADPAAQLIEDFPEISEDGKSVTFTYSKEFADWQYTFDGHTVPAHIVGKRALGVEDPAEAKTAVIEAVENKDNASLAKLAQVWNSDFNFTSLPSEPELYLSNGAYILTDYVENQYLTLKANPDYTGDHKAAIENVTIRYIEDSQAQVTALENGEVDYIGPQASADVKVALEALGDQVETHFGVEGTYEHVDLVFENDGPFDPASYDGDEETAKAVRKAFLLSIPRQDIVDNLIIPSNPDAAVRNSQILLPGSADYDQMVAENGSSEYPDTGDVDAAAALLDEAGVETPIDVRLAFNADNPRRVSQFALIQDAAQSAGFNVIDASAPAAEWGTLLATQQDQYDASLFGWQSTSTAVTESDANFRTGAINNFGKYSSDEVDGLLDDLQVEIDPAKQLELQIAVEKELWEDAFGITIFQFPAVQAWKPTLQGVRASTISPTIFNEFWNWSIATA